MIRGHVKELVILELDERIAFFNQLLGGCLYGRRLSLDLFGIFTFKFKLTKELRLREQIVMGENWS